MTWNGATTRATKTSRYGTNCMTRDSDASRRGTDAVPQELAGRRETDAATREGDATRHSTKAVTRDAKTNRHGTDCLPQEHASRHGTGGRTNGADGVRRSHRPRGDDGAAPGGDRAGPRSRKSKALGPHAPAARAPAVRHVFTSPGTWPPSAR